MRLRLILSYEGTSFKGWQKQKALCETVQQSLETALSQIFDQSISVVGSGRTDAGVHALAQNAHFDLKGGVKNSLSSLRDSLNALTPSSISCRSVMKAPLEFHARKSAKSRSYIYLISNSEIPSAFSERYMWRRKEPIFYKNLNSMAQCLLGVKDFKSFQNSGSQVKSSKRHVYQAGWRWIRPSVLSFRIEASGFLKQMVRNLVASQLKLMSRKNCIFLFKSILDSKDRLTAGATAPPQGLFLHKVSYPVFLDKKCEKL